MKSNRILRLLRANKIIIVGGGFLICFVILEAIAHVHVSPSDDLIKELFYPSLYEAWMRVALLFLGTVILIYAQRLLDQANEVREKLRESEEKYRAIFEQASDSVLLLSTTGDILEFNDKAHENLGYTREEFKNIKLSEIEKMETRNEVLKHLATIVRTGHDKFETKHRRKNKEIRDIFVKAKSITVGNEKFVYTTWNDITERKKEEYLVKGERDKAQTYLDIAGVMLLALGPDEKVTLINKRGCEILGYTEKEVIGKNWFENFLPARARKEVREVFGKLISGEMKKVEYVEGPVITKIGEERTILWHNTVLRDKKGAIVETFTSGEDVTERKKMEEEIFKKNEELESFVYTVSHDLRSPLVTFNGFVEYLTIRNKDKFDAESERVIERLRANVRHMDNLIKDLLELSRVGRVSADKEKLSVLWLFNETIKRFEVALTKEKIEITTDCEEDRTVYADILRISQVLDNLIENSIKFIDDPEKRKISLICKKADDKQKVRICVKDNGIGIDPKYHDKIFEIFHRLGDVATDAEGTGVGLTLVKKIVEEHKGRIWVVSEKGKGSEFWLELPVSEGGQ